MEALVLAALNLTSLIMERTPTYAQSKRNKFNKLKEKYESEIKMPFGRRNDRLVLDVGDELRGYVEDFSAIVGTQSIPGVR